MPPSPSKETTSYAPRRVPGTRATGSGWIIEDGYFSSDCSVTTRKCRSVYQSQRRRRVETRQGSRSLARSSTHERDFVALGFHLGFQSRLCGIGGGEFLRKTGEPGGNRTLNPQIKSLLLCQLSYRPQRRAIGRNETTILSSAAVFRPLSRFWGAPPRHFLRSSVSRVLDRVSRVFDRLSRLFDRASRA